MIKRFCIITLALYCCIGYISALSAQQAPVTQAQTVQTSVKKTTSSVVSTSAKGHSPKKVTSKKRHTKSLIITTVVSFIGGIVSVVAAGAGLLLSL